MTNSTMRQPLPAALAGQMASGYKPGQEAGKFEIIGPAPAGSLSATGTDMAKFMIAHLDKGKGLLSPEAAAQMQNSPLDKFNPVSLLPPLNRMRLGFFETNINGREVIGHLGDTEFFHTSLHLLMKEGVGIYFSFNSGGREGIVQTLRWSLFEDFADRYFPAKHGGGCAARCENGRRTRRHDGRQLAGEPHGLEQSDRRAAAHRPDQSGCRAERRAADSGAARCEQAAARVGRDRAVRLAREGRARPARREGRKWQGGPLELRPARALHGVRSRAGASFVELDHAGCFRQPWRSAADGSVLAHRAGSRGADTARRSRSPAPRCVLTSGRAGHRWPWCSSSSVGRR